VGPVHARGQGHRPAGRRGKEVAEGEELFEVETEKIDGAVESPAAGVLRRRVAEVGAVVPVGGLVGVRASTASRRP
jgi:pyruvate dehydrogenase E2 component (dihydrolipoamide acetyltransferase)